MLLLKKNASSEEEKERLATYFIKDWGGIAKISDARKIVSRFNPVSFSKPSVKLISVLKE